MSVNQPGNLTGLPIEERLQRTELASKKKNVMLVFQRMVFRLPHLVYIPCICVVGFVLLKYLVLKIP